ncbi:unnamed protein product [Callosobruchus maculatus]|uniref:Uncharacterized protein n=1 Tax=Callosobruchus maculatus TaxID=64391 RepID=A0A653BHX5_CALMS|nr:unnamed protein product [Callosobruchus maculatus]
MYLNNRFNQTIKKTNCRIIIEQNTSYTHNNFRRHSTKLSEFSLKIIDS